MEWLRLYIVHYCNTIPPRFCGNHTQHILITCSVLANDVELFGSRAPLRRRPRVAGIKFWQHVVSLFPTQCVNMSQPNRPIKPSSGSSSSSRPQPVKATQPFTLRQPSPTKPQAAVSAATSTKKSPRSSPSLFTPDRFSPRGRVPADSRSSPERRSPVAVGQSHLCSNRGNKNRLSVLCSGFRVSFVCLSCFLSLMFGSSCLAPPTLSSLTHVAVIRCRSFTPKFHSTCFVTRQQLVASQDWFAGYALCQRRSLVQPRSSISHAPCGEQINSGALSDAIV